MTGGSEPYGRTHAYTNSSTTPPPKAIFLAIDAIKRKSYLTHDSPGCGVVWMVHCFNAVGEMTLSSKRELIQAIRKVYRKSTKAQKSSHLDHLELATGLKRNYLNRLLLQGYKAKRRKPGRKSRYATSPGNAYYASCKQKGARTVGSC